MPYGPIDSREPFTPEYKLGANVFDANGEIILIVNISAELNDYAFAEEGDVAVQALLDLLNDSPIFTVSTGYKSWKSNRTITPTP